MLRRLILVICLALGSTLASAAQNGDAAPPVSLKSLNDQLEAVRADTTLDDAARASLTTLYEQAVAQLRAAEEFATKQAEYADKAAEAPAQLTAIREELSAPVEVPKVELPADATLDVVRKWVQEAEAELVEARRRVEELRVEAETRGTRRATIGEEQAAGRTQLLDLEQQLQATVTPTDDAGRARLALLHAKVALARQRLTMLDEEARSYDARAELLPARRDRAGRRVNIAEQVVAARETLAKKFGQDEVKRERERAVEIAEAVESRYPELVAISSRIEQLVAERQRAQTQYEQVSRRLNEARDELLRLRRGAAAARRQVDVAGLTRAIGILLRQELRGLPEVRVAQQHLDTTTDQLADIQLKLVVLDQERAEAGDVEEDLAALLAKFNGADEPDDRASREAVSRDLLIRRRDMLDAASTDWNRTFDRALELDLALRALVEDTRSYQQYIEERILWVRSVTGGPRTSVTAIGDGLAWMLDPTAWKQILKVAQRQVAGSWPAAAATIVLLLTLVASRGLLRRRLADLAQRVSGVGTDSIWWTVLSLVIAFLAAAPGPLLLLALGRLLSNTDNEVGYAVGQGMISTAPTLLTLELLRQVLRRDGAGPVHFRWPPRMAARVRRQVGLLLLIFVPSVFLWLTFEVQDQDSTWSEGPGRLALITGMAAAIFFSVRIFSSKGPLHADVISHVPRLVRTRKLWFSALILIPLTIIVLSLLGYHYTAIRLEESVAETVRLCLALVIVHALMVRWLVLAKRRILVAERRKRREAAEAAAREGGEAMPPVEEESIDVPAIDVKTRHLFRSVITAAFLIGLFVLWSDVLPALGMLDRVQLWPRIAIVDLPSTADAGNGVISNGATPPPTAEPNSGSSMTPMTPMPVTDTETVSDPTDANRITLGNLVVALVFASLTIISVRTLPALLEIAVVSRLPLDAGARYALLTVIKYAIMIAGVMISFGAMGIGWAKVQWIAAALTFGLAFGLQEIFANFISGLIILAERPIRVGDTVTVHNISGTVARIRMRATTITDWDRKEIVIPNKAFITEQVINWSLTDPILRVIIAVGLSYGADVEKAERLLYTIAGRHPKVLVDPAPRVIFRSFGDSTLDFQLRIFIPNIDEMFSITHEIHMQIIKEFRTAGIEIAFPQRDLHLRSAIPVEIVNPGSPPTAVEVE